MDNPNIFIPLKSMLNVNSERKTILKAINNSTSFNKEFTDSD